MKLTGKVIKVESGDDYGDKIERITIRFNEGDGMYKELRLPNLDGYKLNEQILVSLAPQSAMQNLRAAS